LEPWTSQAGRFTSAYDRLEIDCHGLEITHLDALNHFGLDGRWYKGVPSNPNEGVSLEEIASEPLLTRAVFLDIAEARGEPWVEVDAPVGRDDLDAALSLAQTDVERGDALLLYMGRDRLEATGRSLKPVADSPEGRPGVGAEGSRWIAEREASLVAWDLLDAHGPGQLPLSVHLLVWAIGLLLVDNCDFGVLRSHVCRKRPRVGMFVVCPLRIAGATGCAVNPLVLL
jgi:kynurenine formamidase